MENSAKIIATAVKKLWDLDVEVKLTEPDAKFGDFATNVALQIAGKVDEVPRVVAKKIVEEIEGDFDDLSIAGPGFINFRVPAKTLAKQLFDIQIGEIISQTGAGKTVIVEYPSPNMAKPFSVGHMRPANQGWATRNLMIATGWRVITDNHLGDSGSPFGIWVVGFEKFSSAEKLAERGIYELGDIYIQTKKALKDEELAGETALAEEAQEWLLKLENGDEIAVNYSNAFNKISLDHIHNIMGRMGISTDYELGEKFYVEQGKNEVQKLLKNGIATQNSDGSVIADLNEFGIETPILLQKSNGAALYATTDLGTLTYREKEFKPDRVIYVVAAEQQFYFRQLFALAKKIGIKTELIHEWFGLIDQLNEDGTREKMSSRKGVVLMEELLDFAENKAREIAKNEINDDDVRKIAIGAIKFTDFAQDRKTNILFDWDRMFSLTGFSGPYLQYAAVRINKILRDIESPNVDISGFDFEQEKTLIMKLLNYPEIVEQAAADLEPHKIATYLYELARELNKYYEKVRISDSNDIEKTARLALLIRVAKTFELGLKILGIEIPSKM